MRPTAAKLLISSLLGFVAVLIAAVPAGALTPSQPLETSLSASPSSVSWPDATDFQYRLGVKAGPEGLDATVTFRGSPWGIDRVDGSPVEVGRARLEGSGELEVIPVAMPMVLNLNACYRGAMGWPSMFRLTLGPGESATVLADAKLLAAPLPGMNQGITAEFRREEGGIEELLTAPLAIRGKQGVLIKTDFAGAKKAHSIQRIPSGGFRLAGSTDPALPRTEILIKATGIMGVKAPRTVRLVKVRTDGDGRFRTGKLKLKRTGIWKLNTALANPGEFDNHPHCAGVVRVWPKKRRATTANLNGHTYVSTSVWGRDLKGQKVRLKFFRHADVTGRPKRPTMVASAGCNQLGTRYRAKNGRLRWTGRVIGTKMACRPSHDRWLTGLLRRGMRATLAGDSLVLTTRKTEIVLRRVR